MFVMILLVCFMFRGSESRAQDNVVLKGKVIDKETNSILNLSVITLQSKVTDEVFSTQSDVSGNYEFRNLTIGEYTIAANAVGYYEATKDVELAAGINTIDIFLEQSDIETEKINVTATKTETTLRQTPSSVSVVSSDEIAAKNILTFDNVL